MNVWLIGATVLLGGFLPCLWVLLREPAIDGVVALQVAGAAGTLVLLLLAEGYHRSDYFVVPVALAFLSFVGTLLYARFLGRHL